MLPYLLLYRVRGRQYAYYRRHGSRLRLRGEVGSPEFLAAYQAAHAAAETVQSPAPAPGQALPGSFRALVEAYKSAPGYLELAPATRSDYDRLLAPMVEARGACQVAKLPRQWILSERDKLAATPRKANKTIAVLRLLLAFAVDREMLAVNPALRIKPLRTGPGHRTWTPAELATMTSSAAGAIGLPVLLGYHTAQRLGDVLRLLWSAYDGRAIRLRQRKTGAEVMIPVEVDLRRTLDTMPRTAAVMCLTPTGRPWREDHFKHRFAAVRADLGLPDDLHFHGLRHTRLTDIAEAGGSDAELAAISGHRSRSMVARYTRTAGQERLATSAIRRVTSARDRGD